MATSQGRKKVPNALQRHSKTNIVLLHKHRIGAVGVDDAAVPDFVPVGQIVVNIAFFLGLEDLLLSKDDTGGPDGVGDLTVAHLIDGQILFSGIPDQVPGQIDHDQEEYNGSDIQI